MTMTLLCFLATASAPVTWVYININGQLYTAIALQFKYVCVSMSSICCDLISLLVLCVKAVDKRATILLSPSQQQPFLSLYRMQWPMNWSTVMFPHWWVVSHDSHMTVAWQSCDSASTHPLIVTTYNVMRVHRYWMYINATCIKRWKHEVNVITTLTVRSCQLLQGILCICALVSWLVVSPCSTCRRIGSSSPGRGCRQNGKSPI